MIQKTQLQSQIGIRFSVTSEQGEEVGHAYLYCMYNDLHDQPFGLMEDVYIDDQVRGQGYGSKLIQDLIEEARSQGCYKLIGTSRMERPQVHILYEKLGFDKYGYEFRLTF